MAEQLTTASVAAPGFLGLNTQDSGVTLESGYATVAENCVIDKFGRIGARKGWTPVNSVSTALGSNPVQTIFEVVKADGNVVLSAGNNKLFSGTSSLAQLAVRNSDNSGDLSYTISDNHWQIVAQPYSSGIGASAHAFLAQAGQPTLVYHKLGATAHAHTGSYGLQRLGDIGTLPFGYSTATFTPNVALAAFGRVWYADIAADNQTVYFSDLNDGTKLTGGTSGFLNIADIVPEGDPIVALAAHNSFLVIFCKQNIVIYQNADDITNIRLSDQVKGIGCIARDSVVTIGTDLVFLSSTGVRSLLRTIQEKSAPIRDLSANVRDDVVEALANEQVKKIKGVYSEKDAFYALSFPTMGIIYVFDVRSQLQNGAARATTWRLTVNSFNVTAAKSLYLGMTGYIGSYGGYADNTSTYRFKYYTNWFDFNQPTVTKILKKIGLTFIGGNGLDVSIKWAFDYALAYQATSYTLGTESISEYGIAEYNIGEYTAGVVFDNQKTQLGGSGSAIQLGVEVVIENAELSVQKMDCYVKQGKVR